jgi:transcriptional regulator with XRE-family HTH domain
MTQEVLVQLRKKAGLSQQAVGEKLGGYSRDTIRRWEKKRDFPGRIIPKLSNLYGVGEEVILQAIAGNTTPAPEAPTENS